MSTLTTPVQHFTKGLRQYNKREKEKIIIRTEIGKDAMEPPLFKDDFDIYIKISQSLYKQLLELLNNLKDNRI